MQKLSPELTKKILIIFLIVLILPFMINCFFAYPQSDDFCYSYISQSMGFFKAQYKVYVTWSGRFTSTALLCINPLVYQSIAAYRFVFAVFILSQLASIYLLVGAVTKRTLSWQEKLIFSLMLLFAFLDQMDDIRSGLYWMAGVATYQVAETLLFLYIALFLMINQDRKHDTVLNKCVVILLALLLGGTNEIVMVLSLLISSLLVLHSYSSRKSISPFQAGVFVAVVTGSCICLLAPGNFSRLSEYHDRKNIFITSWNALHSALSSMEVWVTSPLTLILTGMVLIAILCKPQLKTLFADFKIVRSVCLLLFLMFLCFFIPYWSTGMYPQNRAINMIYLLFLLGWMMNVALIFARFGEPIVHSINRIPIKTGCIVATAFMILLFTFGTSNFMLVAKDLLNGESFRYNAQMRQRELQTVNSGEDDLTLDNIASPPRSLFFSFISQDRTYWVNGCYAKYFGKKSVALINNNSCNPELTTTSHE
jgi:hypothetical protein